MEPQLLVREQGAVCEIILNRPEAYNALSDTLMLQLRAALLAFKANPLLRVGILRGEGKNFCSGADIKQFGATDAQTPESIRARAALAKEVYSMFPSIRKPIICSVQGYVLAGGCGLAMAGDIVLAAQNAVFGYPEVQRGFVAALVMTNLAKIVGRRKALELLLTGRKINAEEALAAGMVTEVVAEERLADRTWELAEKLAAFSPDSMAYTKALYYRVSDLDFARGMDCGEEVNIMLRQTADFAKGMQAFKNGNGKNEG